MYKYTSINLKVPHHIPYKGSLENTRILNTEATQIADRPTFGLAYLQWIINGSFNIFQMSFIEYDTDLDI